MRVLVALAGLTMDEREAVVDHEVLGRSYAQIGVTLGVCVETVRRARNRALRKLETSLGEAA